MTVSMRPTISALAALAMALGICSCSNAESGAVGVGIESSFDFGAADDFEPGVTAVSTPYPVFVVNNGTAIETVLQAKDPNNGCKLFLVADLPDVEAHAAAVFYDQCHGHQYSIDGVALDDDDANPIRSVDFEIRDSRLIWDTSTTLTVDD